MSKWRRYHDPKLGSVPDWLAESLDAGRPILVASRTSTASGTTARRDAIADVHDGLDLLRTRVGLDFADLLPRTAVLEQLLKNAPAIKSKSADGKSFEHRVVSLTDNADSGVIFLICTGTGRQANATFDQPFVENVVSTMTSSAAAMVACKEQDRISRLGSGISKLCLAVRTLECGYLDSKRGPTSELTPLDEQIMMSDAAASDVSIDRTVRGFSRGQKSLTGSSMANGRVPFHLHASAPPGMDTAWLRPTTNRMSERVLFFDTDATRPALQDTAQNRSEVRSASGEGYADQVKNVRFALEHLGLPGWSTRDVAKHLANDRYSTEGLRNYHHDPARYFDTDQVGREPKSVITSLIDNLDLYETGVLVRKTADGQAHEIHDCFPPDGEPWASEESLARIRSWLQHRRKASKERAALTFGGQRAQLTGSGEVEFRSYGRGGYRGRNPAYGIAYPGGRQAFRYANISARAFGQSIRRGLVAADGVPLALVEDLPEDSEVTRLKSDLKEAVANLAATEQALEGMLEQMREVDPGTGKRRVHGFYLTDLTKDINETKGQILPLELKVEDLRSHLDIATQHRAAAGVDQLAELYSSLEDPFDVTFRGIWRSALHGLVFETEEGNGYRLVRWTGFIRVSEGDAAIDVPFCGSAELSHANNFVGESDSPTSQAIAALREGRTTGTESWRFKAKQKAAIASQLGCQPDSYLLQRNFSDPLLGQIAAELFVAEGTDQVRNVANRLGVEQNLVERVLDVHVHATPRRWWARPASKHIVEMHVLASENNGLAKRSSVAVRADSTVASVYATVSNKREEIPWWTATPEAFKLDPCDCGSMTMAPLRIPEPVGPVCLSCGSDRAGILWDLDTYNKYISHPESWDSVESKSARSA